MASTEWWTVETAEGTSLDGTRYPNEEAADAAAQAGAAAVDGVLMTVCYQRTEVTEYQRTVTVDSTAVGTAPVA